MNAERVRREIPDEEPDLFPETLPNGNLGWGMRLLLAGVMLGVLALLFAPLFFR